MWGRANFVAVIFLFSCSLNFACAQGGNKEPDAVEAEVENIVERGTTWLWNQREKDGGWRNDTHRVLLVLRMANLTQDESFAPLSSVEMQISAKQLELEVVLLLWRHREASFSPVRLARYTLALNAMCIDPKEFYGHDLMGTLQHHESATDYDFALITLATCSAQTHVRRRQIRRLLDIANAAQDHNVDTLSMVILALRCLVQDHRHRNLHHFIRKPSIALAQQQRTDGSFGDVRTTALAMQALEESENEPAANWNRSAAVGWLANQQSSDGSFAEDVRTTAEAVLAVSSHGLANIRSIECTEPPAATSIPKFTVTNDMANTRNESDTTERVRNSLTGNVSNTESTVPAVTFAPVLVNISYTLWVGSNVNETYNLTLMAPRNEKFYNVMLLAAEMSPHFQFSAYSWPNGHYVHTLAGYKEEPMSYHYWLLYRLPSPPESSSPPGNQLVAPGGVDDLQIGEGEHYLFWYKKL